MSELYKCGMCNGEFEKTWSDEEALAESKEYFGDIPAEARVIVCDDCWEAIKPASKAS